VTESDQRSYQIKRLGGNLTLVFGGFGGTEFGDIFNTRYHYQSNEG
jgi:hypothetical protein